MKSRLVSALPPTPLEKQSPLTATLTSSQALLKTVDQGSNGSPSRSPSRLPHPRGISRTAKLLLLATALVVTTAVGGGVWYVLAGSNSHRRDLVLYTMK